MALLLSVRVPKNSSFEWANVLRKDGPMIYVDYSSGRHAPEWIMAQSVEEEKEEKAAEVAVSYGDRVYLPKLSSWKWATVLQESGGLTMVAFDSDPRPQYVCTGSISYIGAYRPRIKVKKGDVSFVPMNSGYETVEVDEVGQTFVAVTVVSSMKGNIILANSIGWATTKQEVAAFKAAAGMGGKKTNLTPEDGVAVQCGNCSIL